MRIVKRVESLPKHVNVRKRKKRILVLKEETGTSVSDKGVMDVIDI